MMELDMKNPFDQSYHDMLEKILTEGVRKADRTGTGTISIFGHMQKFDMSNGFPLITTKDVWLKGIIHELLWMLSGSTNIKYLKDNGVKIWDDWADEYGSIGRGYGTQWRSWISYESRIEVQADKKYPVVNGTFIKTEVDQIREICRKLREKPWDRRNMMSAWNVGEIHRMNLPPCHFNAQFNVEPRDPIIGYDAHQRSMSEPPPADGTETHACEKCGREDSETINGCDLCFHCIGNSPPIPHKLHCLMNIRSWDTFLGGPFNIAQYALLTMMLAQVSGLEPGVLTICSGDTHLYLNHLEQTKLQISREPFAPPKMVLDPSVTDIDDFKYEHFKLEGYEHHPHIKGDISI